jgi:TATA-box binding protein (TBP) (component of TFIID and TFIIIB)
MVPSIRAQLFNFRNCVCQATLQCSFPFLLVPSLLTRARCEPQLFPASVARLYISRCTLSVFCQGKVMVMGSSSEYNSRLALTKLCQIINGTIPGMNCRVARFVVVNRVASCRLGFDVDMPRLTRDWKFMGLWEKTSFPGFKLSVSDIGASFVIFEKGTKVNIAGIRSPSLMRRIARRMRMFNQYRHSPS